MKRVFLSLISAAFFANASDLNAILEYALSHNELSVAKDLDTKKPLLEKEAIQKEYFPKIDIGAMYQRSDPKAFFRPGDTYDAHAKVSLNLFDGNRKRYQIGAKRFELQSLKFASRSFKKGLQFDIVNLYFQVKTLKANLVALQKASEYLEAEYKRVEDLYNVGSVTEDEVKKIEASLLNTIYQIDEMHYRIEEAKKELALRAGKSISGIGNSKITPPAATVKSETLDRIKTLEARQKAVEYSAASLDSAYLPQVNMEDSYHLYGYDRTDAFHPKGEDHENRIMLTFNMRLYDNGSVKKQKEAILVQKLSLQQQITYYEKEQKKNIELALLNIETIKSQITSAEKSLEAANKAFELITNRYHEGAVTVVDYLDALKVKTNAMAQYKAALYSLQVAYAAYYLYINEDIKEFIR